MKLLPQSLFGRLVLVLMGGLVLAQLATAYINLSERGQLLYEASGLRSAERIADIGKLLDSLPEGERRRVIEVFNAPPLTIALDRATMATQSQPQNPDMQLSMFSTALRYALGDAMPVKIIRREGAPASFETSGQFRSSGMPMMSQHMGGNSIHNFSPDGAFFTVQIALHDGNWVTFDTYLSPQAIAIPWRVALTLFILLGTVVALSLVAVQWVIGPLSALANAADKLGADIHGPALPETGPIEVQRAARAFNTMQKRLSLFISDRTRILSAMSHDLKTPITRLRLRTELLDDETVRVKFDKDLRDMESMVTQTLDFMRDASAVEAVQRVDVMTMLESLQTDYADNGGIVGLKGEITEPWRGRPLALRRCLTNLIDNAIRYGKEATVCMEDRADCVSIRVLDQGPGIAEDELDKAFEPFFRGESSRNRDTGGTGLGLGIARNIARAHGGELSLRNRIEGGLEATLTLPRTEAVKLRNELSS